MRHEHELNQCWNSVYKKLFGFNQLESVRVKICGLGDLQHILKKHRIIFHWQLAHATSNSLQDIKFYYHSVTLMKILCMLSN